MKLGFINCLGLLFALVILIPIMIYSLKNKKKKNKYKNKVLYVVEYIAKASAIIFLIFPIGIEEFGFSKVYLFCIYLICNILLSVLYIITYIKYFKKEDLKKAIMISIIPTCMFLISGITLLYVPLIISSLVFGTSHTYISYKNKK